LTGKKEIEKTWNFGFRGKKGNGQKTGWGDEEWRLGRRTILNVEKRTEEALLIEKGEW